jgi:hypothetical protein
LRDANEPPTQHQELFPELWLIQQAIEGGSEEGLSVLAAANEFLHSLGAQDLAIMATE